MSAAFIGVAKAQGVTPNPGWDLCQNGPESVDFAELEINESFPWLDDAPLIQTTLGLRGSVPFAAGCPALPYTVSVAGRYGFGSGSVGSIQSTVDDLMLYTMGMPDFPGNSFAYTSFMLDGTMDKPASKNLFGQAAFPIFFRGVSDRYIFCETKPSPNLDVKLNIDVLGDAARYDWQITNSDPAKAHQIGMWSGGWLTLVNPNLDIHGYITGSGLPGGTPASRLFVSVPNQRPSLLETRWTRAANTSVYPPFIDFDWSQADPYGLRIETGPSPSTTDPVTQVSDATQSDELEVGMHSEISGSAGLMDKYNVQQPSFPDVMFPFVHNEPGIQRSDLQYIDNPAYIIKYAPVNVNSGATREIVQYYRDTWGQSNYAPPYTMVIDGPNVINYDPAGLNQLTPNPATIRVYVDNIKGFTKAEQELPLENVSVNLDLSNTPGMTIVGGGKKQTKTIAKIASRRIAFVDFQVQCDGVANGVETYTVTCQAPPGPIKSIVATVNISTTPKIPVTVGANLITLPWTFSDSSWTAILGLSEPTQFQAFDWDPVQQGYVLSTSAQRGKGTWVVIEDPSVIPQSVLALQSNPQKPGDMGTGADIIQLKQGWNLIGNPYPYTIPLGDIVGVSAGDPTHTVSWTDMVDSGFISGALAYWDITSNPAGYKFISGTDALMEPNTGYWIFVNDLGITLQFPPVFLEGANTGSGAVAIARRALANKWVQSENQWRLMVAARTQDEVDDQNFVGKAATAQAAKTLKMYEPPMGPTQNLGVSIASDQPGGTRLAQSLVTTGTSQWQVFVQNKKGGQVTLTWPNMATVPKNVMFRLTDTSTGTSRDMRRISGYTFTAAPNSTRTFTIQAQPGTASRAIIGNVVVSQPGRGRDRNAPFTISYTLAADATTTVRILGAGGREVYTATRGRADPAGENTASWAMRDNANRAVAPGIYRVEITAETSDGERVRKIVPVNVIR